MNILFLLLAIMMSSIASKGRKFIIAVHGGAGNYNRTLTTLEKEIQVKAGIVDALRAGFDVLRNGGTHLEATKEAIIKLEDDINFNAGKGSKINQNYEIEMDASIMDGSTMQCGAVAGVKHVKNPIRAAELVMNTTPHIFLISKSADAYAKEKGLDYMPNSYFFTEERIQEWEEARREYELTGDIEKHRKGTVGAVVLDSFGHLGAGTSTGGITYKMAGRVGDSPIIGAGNYANDKTCAISCTGTGETMIRNVLAYDIHARMEYKGDSLEKASSDALAETEENTGGLVSVDHKGNVSMPFNSVAMARGYVREDGKAYVYLFPEGEDLTPTEYNINHEHLEFLEG